MDVMTRRSFLAALPALAASTRTYFDLGPSWAIHDSGLAVPRLDLKYGWNVIPPHIIAASQGDGGPELWLSDGQAPPIRVARRLSELAGFSDEEIRMETPLHVQVWREEAEITTCVQKVLSEYEWMKVMTWRP